MEGVDLMKIVDLNVRTVGIPLTCQLRQDPKCPDGCPIVRAI